MIHSAATASRWLICDGNTRENGEHKEKVHRGLEFLATRLLTRWCHASPTPVGAMPEWKTWKEQTRTRILESQEQAGEARGCWFVGKGPVNEHAGRLGDTCLTLIILAAVAADRTAVPPVFIF
jgi:hypothetical protein